MRINRIATGFPTFLETAVMQRIAKKEIAEELREPAYREAMGRMKPKSDCGTFDEIAEKAADGVTLG